MEINKLSAVDTLIGGDNFPIWSPNNGDARRTSLTLLQEYVSNISLLDAGTIVLTDLDSMAVYDASQSKTVQTLLPTLTTYIGQGLIPDLSAGAAIATVDTFPMYDLSATSTVSVTAALITAFVRDNIYTGMTAEATVSDNDLFMIFEDGAGATRSTKASELQTYLQTDLLSKMITQKASPVSTSFTVLINDNSLNTHLILTPTAGFADGAITLPLNTNLIDKQELLVNCTTQIDAFVINKNGATAVQGGPQSLGADSFFRLKYDLAANTWYRVG